MYKKDFGFYEPNNKNCKIWRYLSFTKFIDLILNKHLYFCRLDKFKDPFEGIYPTENTSGNVLQLSEITRKFVFVNCWHINDVESAAMWSIYGESNKGIAIQSTFDKLKTCIEKSDDDVYLSIVKYHDYNTKNEFELFKENRLSPDSLGGTINPVVFKRKSFEYENELRAIYFDLPIEFESEKIKERNLLKNKLIEVNLENLIDKIYISPNSEQYFFEIVKKVCKKFNINSEVIKSNLYDRKVY